MVESIGKKLSRARTSRGLTLEEAAMETRIRAKQLAALEADDYSSFANNTYARGFLLMYGKFLEVDVRAFARELEAGNPISLSDYQYLNAPQDGEEPRPVRRINRESRSEMRRRPSMAPLIAFVVLLAIVGFGAHLYFQAQRLEVGMSSGAPTPAPEAKDQAESAPAVATHTSSVPSPASATPTPSAAVPGLPGATPSPSSSIPTAAPGVAVPSISDRQFLSTTANPPVQGSPAPLVAGAPVNELVLEPLKKTWVRIRRDDPAAEPVFDDVLYPKVGPLKIKGSRFWVEIREADAVTIRKNGQPLAYQPPGITIQ